MRRILIGLIIGVVVVYLAYNGLRARFYRTISQETLVGTVQCAPARDRTHDFYLFYFPGKNADRSDFIFLKLNGDYWAFEGEIIKWKRPVNFAGLRTCHRPVRIYDSKGTSQPLETGPGRFAFRTEKLLPFIDTSFISIVKQPFKPRLKFGIYATNTGYLVRRIR
ncbi:MAG: hypothetical protein PHO42_00855 [Candidatus Omnitrophica bacterium]|nr:hypothetical protein [Candidatus Omnitrophota bacterium]